MDENNVLLIHDPVLEKEMERRYEMLFQYLNQFRDTYLKKKDEEVVQAPIRKAISLAEYRSRNRTSEALLGPGNLQPWKIFYLNKNSSFCFKKKGKKKKIRLTSPDGVRVRLDFQQGIKSGIIKVVRVS